jgi:hypothetical protein
MYNSRKSLNNKVLFFWFSWQNFASFSIGITCERKKNTYNFFCWLQDLTDDLSAVQTRWLSSSQNTSQNMDPKTPDIEAMDMDTYSKSIYNMNDSLHDLHR